MTGDGGFVVLSVWPLCCYFCGMYTNIHTVSYNVFLTDCVHTHRYVWTRNVRSVSGWVSTINIQSIYKIFTFSKCLNLGRCFILILRSDLVNLVVYCILIYTFIYFNFLLQLSVSHLWRGNCSAREQLRSDSPSRFLHSSRQIKY